jgi:acetylornithine deacetylase/succinyl-diaminopimelate desuccinylase-like protein
VATHSQTVEETLDLIRRLAVDIGPRRPCSDEEKQAAELLERWLGEHGVTAERESFDGYASFGHPYALIMGAALVGGLLQRRGRRLGDVLAAVSLAIGALEGDLRFTPLSDLLARQPSANVLARVAAVHEARQVVCLCGHLDTTRSGLIFHPRVIRHLSRLLQLPAASGALLAAGPLLRHLPGGKTLQIPGIAGMVTSLALLVERELRGQDVAGANDNASGAAVAAQLVAECAASPLERTEVRLLVTGCEESGVLGAQAYARRHDEAAWTTFLNFDTVGGDAPLTYILREGSAAATRPASALLVELAQATARRRPDLGLRPAETTPGLPTDATVFRAHGWEAITFLAQSAEGGAPNYHWPTDTYENVSEAAIARALETGRELLRELDRAAGEAVS